MIKPHNKTENRTMTKPLTKKSIIKSLIEASSYMTDSGRVDFEKNVLPQWQNMPAKEIIGEAESVFGYTHTDENGFAV
jgi:hypothetical protein